MPFCVSARTYSHGTGNKPSKHRVLSADRDPGVRVQTRRLNLTDKAVGMGLWFRVGTYEALQIIGVRDRAEGRPAKHHVTLTLQLIYS
jgi:hypothetical protein